MLESQRAALEIRRRLHNPPNAVVDEGIDLKRLKKTKIIINAPEPAPAPEPASAVACTEPLSCSPLLAELDRIQRKLDDLQSRADILRSRHKHGGRVSMRLIQDVVARHFDMPVSDLSLDRRTHKIVWPRHVAEYLCCIRTPSSLPQIGRMFGGQDHTSVLSARNKVERLRAADPDVDALIEKLSTEITNAAGTHGASTA